MNSMKKAMQILDDLVYKLYKSDFDQNTQLFHYTNAAGLNGILGSGNIWATHYLHLNDPKEILSSIHLIQNILEIITTENEYCQKYKTLLTQYIITEAISIYTNSNSKLHDTFIASFSEDEKVLSQWRTYADNGYGYVFGINPSELIRNGDPKKSFGTEQCVFDLIKVIYDIDEQKNIVRTSVCEIINKHKKMVEQDDLDEEQTCDTFNSILLNFTLMAAIIFKRESYHEEKEWRFVHSRTTGFQSNANDINFRNHEHDIIPYINFDLNKTVTGKRPSIAIYHGSKQNKLKAEKTISMLLHNKGYNSNHIDDIDLP